MLKVKDYIKRDKVNFAEDRMTEAFIKYIEGKSLVRYYPHYETFSINSVSFSTKLKTNLFSLEAPYPLKEIYEELTDLCFERNLNHIGFHKFNISPVIIYPDHKGEVRGIIAQIKYIK
jgi:hypothetical protein